MDMRGQGGQGKGTARGASKAPAGGKQTGEQANQGATENKGASMNQGATGNQQTSPNKGMGGQQMGGQQPGGEQDLLQHAKDATGEIMNKVQEQAGSQVNRQKETAASQLSQVADAVRRIKENIPEEAGLARFVGQYGERAANSIERLSNYIREQDAKRLLNDVQNFGRRQPALMLGGAFLLGFAGARLIRSSMDNVSHQGSHYGSRQGSHQRAM